MIHGIKKTVFAWLLLLSALNLPAYATLSVKMFSKEEALTEVNVSRPRIYIQNTGTEAISNVTYYYYFSTEESKIPVLDLYYVNGHTVKLESMGNSLYRVSYTISSSIAPGQSFPDASGHVVGLHYNDWSNWDKTNDYSELNNSTFGENTKIAVYVNNTLVYGTDPVSGGNGGSGNNSPEPPLLTPQLLSFALFSIDSSIVKERTVFSGGGAVGSNNFTKIGIDAVIYGNVLSGGNASLLQRAQIIGDVRAAGEVTTDIGTVVTGEIQQGVDVGTITLPTRSITPGTEDVTVTDSSSRTLAPGIYRDLFIDHYGTLTLSQGNYVFRKVFLETDARVIFNISTNELTSIEISGDLDFSDRSSLTFSNSSYSPSVQILTNDPDSIRIGTDVIISGILIAPQARITMYSRSQCDGAIYAKSIVLEPDSRIMSSTVDPNGDSDHDKVPNYVEIHTGTDPTDSNSFIPVAIPVESMIDNRVKDTTKYTLNDFFDDYDEDDTMAVTSSSGSLKDPDVPIFFTIRDVITSYTGGEDGYVPVSRTIGVIGDPINEGREVTITMPVSQNALPGDYAVVQTGQNGSVLLAAEPVDGGITFKISNNADFTIVKKVNKVVGYFDNGIVYTNEKVARVTLDIAITNCKTTAANPGTADLTYTDYSDPQNPEELTKTINLVQGGNGLVTGTGDFVSKSIGGSIEVTALEIKIPADNFTAKTTCSYMVKPGQWFKVSAGKTEAAYKAQTAVPDKFVFSYAGTNLGFESASLNGEGVARKDPGAANSVFRYSYFYKDHLGTTRMVVNENNSITEAMMYQPYGTYSDVFNAPSADPLREKFTGKEFDEEGAISESEITLDIKISEFPNSDGYSNILTATYQNVVTGNEIVKEWIFNRDETSLWLYRNDRFPDNMKLKKIEIKANGTSQTIDYSKSNFSIEVDCGKKLSVVLNETAQDLVTNNSTDYFTVTGPVVVTDQVAGLGLYYFGARYLDADIGIWMSTDPFEEFWNSYSFVGNDPINNTDPTGLFSTPVRPSSFYPVEGGSKGTIRICTISNGANKGDEKEKEVHVKNLDDSPESGSFLYRFYEKPDQKPSFWDKLGSFLSFAFDNEYFRSLDALDLSDDILGDRAALALNILIPLKALTNPRKVLAGVDDALKVVNNTCFAEGTLVCTKQGFVEIENIKVGDSVLTKDEKSGEVTYSKVLNTFIIKEKEVYSLELGDSHGVVEKFLVTPEHPFFVKDQGFKNVSSINKEDKIELADGEYLSVFSKTLCQKSVTVYNIEVADYNTFFVGKSKVWVHNCKKIPKKILIKGAEEAAEGGYKSFKALKKANPAPAGKVWHHIVEQSQIDRFGTQVINNMKNVTAVTPELNQQLNALYSSIRVTITGSSKLTVREWLSTKSFQEATEFGLKAVENVSKGIW